MKKLFFLLLIFQEAISQNISDTTTILHTHWKVNKISKGLVWKSFHFDQKQSGSVPLFSSNQSINMLEVKLTNKHLKFALASADSSTKTDHSHGILKPTSTIATANNAIAAVNAGFFDTKNGGAVDFIKVNNIVMDTTRLSAKQRLPFHAISALTINKNQVKIIKGEQDKGWENNLTDEYVLLTGPLLLLNNEVQSLPKTPFNDNRHPRTCACLTNNKKLLLITVDGRTPEAHGMTLHELTTFTKVMGCRDAINFDGGGSSTMYIAGQPSNGVVNYPCDNKKYDHEGERSVSNIFMITKK